MGFTGTVIFFSAKGTATRQRMPPERGMANLLRGLGTLNLMFGGIILCSNARTAFIKLDMPAEASE